MVFVKSADGSHSPVHGHLIVRSVKQVSREGAEDECVVATVFAMVAQHQLVQNALSALRKTHPKKTVHNCHNAVRERQITFWKNYMGRN